ncbi:hypothetical protein SCHPADRAFT_319223 [Schizopora paradoxa]|uniref:Uncharacterized protein n=1 Tax=Schizopora paradoxa TaxID=27342 RepID=A0A0H2RRV2_9AGAM|nr:hypothetical protein SCHPADRAFT_319223 [Schizopora paradoxa]
MSTNPTPDDLPWPELSTVSRGATRGNQGSKGSLGTADASGRALLQLRVQPGVLTVRLNVRTTRVYTMLLQDVAQALKLTKTYWRKARRRQDYDQRRDQEHMELHEWLQQLKDKVMASLEGMLQRGEIGAPGGGAGGVPGGAGAVTGGMGPGAGAYEMPDSLELTFLRGYEDRRRRGVPHNPRLRAAGVQGTGLTEGVSPSSGARGSSHMEGDGDDDDGDGDGGSVEADTSGAGPSSWSGQRSPGGFGLPPPTPTSTSGNTGPGNSPSWPKLPDPVLANLPGEFGNAARKLESKRA